MDIERLIVNLMRATKVDWIDDHAVARAVGWDRRYGSWYSPEAVRDARKRRRALREVADPVELPRFTQEIGAAMSLFPADWPKRLIMTWQHGATWKIEFWIGKTRHELVHSLLPVGLCIAALKVRAA
jgi:hypothetical protein